MDEGQGANKGVPVNEYLVKTLRPEDEGKALSDQNHHISSLSPLNTDGLKLIGGDNLYHLLNNGSIWAAFFN
nr:hypothetical protein [Tanacetum cinerariifolium]